MVMQMRPDFSEPASGDTDAMTEETKLLERQRLRAQWGGVS